MNVKNATSTMSSVRVTKEGKKKERNHDKTEILTSPLKKQNTKDTNTPCKVRKLKLNL